MTAALAVTPVVMERAGCFHADGGIGLAWDEERTLQLEDNTVPRSYPENLDDSLPIQPSPTALRPSRHLKALVAAFYFAFPPRLSLALGAHHLHTAVSPAPSWRAGQSDMNEHLVQGPGLTGDVAPGLEHTLGPLSGDRSLVPSRPGTPLSAKLRRHGVKAVSALKSLTNSCKCRERKMF